VRRSLNPDKGDRAPESDVFVRGVFLKLEAGKDFLKAQRIKHSRGPGGSRFMERGMAAKPFIDLSTLDLTKIQFTREQVYAHLPHRYEFMQVDGIVHYDREKRMGVGLKIVREDEFWVKGHIPDRPLFPGVLMIETAAQMAAFLSHQDTPDERFMGFGGVDHVRFRGTVVPPSTMYFLLKVVEIKPRRTIADAQGIVDGKLVFEGRFIGMPI